MSQESQNARPKRRDMLVLRLSQIYVEGGFNKRTEANYGTQEEIALIAKSIQKVGQKDPIRVTKTDEGYKLTVGHRRLRAFKLIADETGTDPEVLAIAGASGKNDRLVEQFVENLKRPNTEVEQATLVQELLDSGMERDEILESLGMKQHTFYNLLELLKAGPEALEEVKSGSMSATTALNIVRKNKTGKKVDVEAVTKEVKQAAAKAKAEGKKKATARHAEGVKSKTVQSVLREVLENLGKQEAKGSLPKGTAFAQGLLSLINEKASTVKIMKFIKEGK